MKAGKYTIRELFVNSYIDQIIIPEIQRDYVWGDEQVIGLLDSISKEYELFLNAEIKVDSPDQQLKGLFEEFIRKQKYSSNIGFIYAYNDPEYSGKYFLIDGQQRITTIYLLLLAVAIKVDKTIFEKYYFTNETLKLDYRVRDSAHSFLKCFVRHILDGNDSKDETITNQHWYFYPYKIDLTIPSVIRNYNSITEYISKNKLGTDSFFKYIQNYIEFWYFDTNMSDQGEELYIYMNARGEQIQTNENLKADLLDTVSGEVAKNNWGIKWEEWQDFFWQRKSSNENADISFNEFINCVAGLEYYLLRLVDKKLPLKPLNKLLTLEKIEKYVNTLRYLENERGNFETLYGYSGWVDDYFKMIWAHLRKQNTRKTDWFADFRDKNKNDERNAMVLVWPLFYYFRETDNPNPVTLFRLLRFFFVRHNNFNRSVPTLKNTIDLLLVNGVIDKMDNQLSEKVDDPEEESDTKLRTEEESEKYKFLSKFTGDEKQLREYESVIWNIEDHVYNLDGKYLKNINISHLVDFSSNPSLSDLKKIRDYFFHLVLEYDEHDLINLLLHYGEFWYRESPYYYYNFKFNDTRRIIRGADGDPNVFKNFFKDFISYPKPPSLKDMIQQKNMEFLDANINDITSITDFRKQLIVYSILLGEELWDSGFHMCYEGEEETRLFDKEYAIFNTSRYKGSHWYLWEYVKEKYNADRNEILDVLKLKLKELQAV